MFCAVLLNRGAAHNPRAHLGVKSGVVEEESSRRPTMLWTIFVILLVLWLLGVVSSYTLGGFIHILLVLALVVLVIQLITGRRAV
jgi:Family of unknown function (DUF5670)